MRLADKVSIITGAGRGIGRAIARAFAEEGSALTLVARTGEQVEEVARQLQRQGAKALPICADVASMEDLDRVVNETLKTFGAPNVLVNNAGIFIYKRFLDWTEAEFDTTLAINTKAAFFLCQKVLPHMLEQGGGKIINISSIHGKVGDVNIAGHCVSKFGLLGLTQALARELKKVNICINAICPGAVETKTIESQSFQGLSPLDSKLSPESVARVAVFLASHDSDAISGAALDIFGGSSVIIS
ncbi:MAG: SDR family oxidoreductase [Candidatus Tectomicrobia bacterium]|nr:SDR family oxidoreductase [Candidatus Tectomicrobia bacterium]